MKVSLSDYWPKVVATLKDRDPFVLVAPPNCWFYITNNPEVCEAFNSLPIIHGANADWEMFGRFDQLKFPVKDQMIDWSTGFNFYTCQSGHRHILPIYHKENGTAFNLLNLCPFSVEHDDRFEISGWQECECGRLRPHLDFCCHQRNYLDINRAIVSKLSGYVNLQLIDVGGVLHVCRTPAQDDGLLESLSDLGYKVKDCPNQYCRVGAKLYNFWTAGSSLVDFQPYVSVADLNQRRDILL